MDITHQKKKGERLNVPVFHAFIGKTLQISFAEDYRIFPQIKKAHSWIGLDFDKAQINAFKVFFQT